MYHILGHENMISFEELNVKNYSISSRSFLVSIVED